MPNLRRSVMMQINDRQWHFGRKAVLHAAAFFDLEALAESTGSPIRMKLDARHRVM
jgi:hypothetical protein